MVFVAIFIENSMRYTILLIALLSFFVGLAQPALDLKEIMKGQAFTGFWPESPSWNLQGTAIYFRWNKDGKEEAEPYVYWVKTAALNEISEKDYREVVFFDKSQAKFPNQLSILGNSLVLTDRKTGVSNILFQTDHLLSDLTRVSGNYASLRMDDDFYALDFSASGTNRFVQLTHYVGPINQKTPDSTYLQRQQVELFQYISDHSKKTKSPIYSRFDLIKETELPSDFGSISGRFLQLPNKVVFLRVEDPTNDMSTSVPAFITSDGYVQSMDARAKVSNNEPNQKMYLHMISQDTLVQLDFGALTDIRKKPSYMDTTGGMFLKQDRNLFIHDPVFADSKALALLDVRAADNKDRWIVLVDLKTAKVTEIEHQHDEAWIGGPGISEWNMEGGTLGFAQQDEVVFFQSEENGFSQLYEWQFSSKKKDLVYPGTADFEMHSVALSSDGTKYFVTDNLSNPGVVNLASIHRIHKKRVPLLRINEGGVKDVAMSPDEQSFAYLYSTATNPWEICLKIGERQVTRVTHSQSQSFKDYSWKTPNYIRFKASDGKDVHARMYEPSPEAKNGAAVLFVHGAGYLQNAHSWWSQYYREYMFHNLLVDKGFTVLDVDYRASAGYGRDYRTAVYRHMGGRDVQDFIDAKKYLVEKFKIDSTRVGIYGGSYGGFVTLMGLFQHPDAFACGAALRSVTDWAHYNQEYTSNILNYPETDTLSYRRSSPIYYAEGLNKPLLMLHGMVDDNVQFQDIIRLQQRLIELGKKDWELAAYPVESHGFQEAYSWHDEYRRILNLFETHLTLKK